MIKVNVSSVLEDQKSSDKLLDETVEKIEGGIELTGNLLIKARIFKIEVGVLADVSVLGKKKCICDRCLERFEKKIDKNFSQEFVVKTGNLKNKEEIDNRQVGFIIDYKNEIDLEKPIIEEILLDNERNICKDTCKGICQKCGISLNKEKCNCNNKIKAKNPFNKLKDLEMTED